MTFYAHSLLGQDKSEWQTVLDHLTNTAKLASTLGKDTNIENFAYIAALFHDIGKYSVEFQNRLVNPQGKVDHSTAGAQEIIKLFSHNPTEMIISKLLAYCISGHHGGLLDHGSVIDVAEDSSLQARLKREIKDYSAYKNEINCQDFEFPQKIPIFPTTKNFGYSLSFFTRMVYSILVDADFQETETFMNQKTKPRGGYPSIDDLHVSFFTYLKIFEQPKTEIAVKRNETLAQCISQSIEKPGFFKLTVPTGGGKTLSSMAFAINHAKINDLSRIIYVIPYTTIIEQNANVFKNILGNDVILEHHSNFDFHSIKNNPSEEDSKYDLLSEKLKLASENWDIPIIVTTNVQFFESLYSNRSSRCRKLHNLVKSIIILDEAQMLPVGYIKPCIYALSELVQNYGTSVVFCTATQPPLEEFFPKPVQITNLVKNTDDLFRFYRRVQVENLGIVTDQEIADRINQNRQALCIVNTRKHARAIFDLLGQSDSFHLSTLMCPAHRKKVIEMIRNDLKNDSPCRVVSTQLIEAGVDISFPTGFRSMAGIDSIIQAAGRINRENEYKNSSTLYLFESSSQQENQIPAEIRQNIEISRKILRDFLDPICPQAITEYYKLLYELKDGNETDIQNILECFENGSPVNTEFNFKTASERFQLIDQPTIPVVIKYDEMAEQILNDVKKTDYPKSFSRSLQPYTVNLFESQYKALQEGGLIDTYNDCFEVINSHDQYNEVTGLQIPETNGTKSIII